MASLRTFLWSRNFRLFVAGVLILFVLGKLVKTERPPAVAAVKVELIEKYQVAAETSGRIQPLSEVFVSVQRGGRLDKVLVQPGMPVKKDQLIAVVDEAFQKSAVQSALSNYQLAVAELGRLQGLFRSSAATAQELDQGRNAVNMRRAELEQARQRLEDGLVRAPVDGTMSILPFALGETLPDGARVAVIEDRSAFRLRAVLPLAAQPYLQQRAEVGIWRYGSVRPPEDQLARVAAELQVTPLAQSVGSGELDVEFRFARLPGELKSGDLVNVRVPLRQVENAVRIPAVALQREAGSSVYVLIADANGYLSKQSVEVVDNLGDAVVVTGFGAASSSIVAPLLADKVREALSQKKRVEVRKRAG